MISNRSRWLQPSKNFLRLLLANRSLSPNYFIRLQFHFLPAKSLYWLIFNIICNQGRLWRQHSQYYCLFLSRSFVLHRKLNISDYMKFDIFYLYSSTLTGRGNWVGQSRTCGLFNHCSINFHDQTGCIWYHFAYDHTTMNTPVLVWSRKLSIVGPG